MLRMIIENLLILNVMQFVLAIQAKHVVAKIEFRYTILKVSNLEFSNSIVFAHDLKTFRKF